LLIHVEDQQVGIPGDEEVGGASIGGGQEHVVCRITRNRRYNLWLNDNRGADEIQNGQGVTSGDAELFSREFLLR
jgi:hypothetical protein